MTASLEREVRAEEDGGAVVVPLETDDGVIDITVPAAEEWRDSAMEAIREGRFTAWAAKTLSEDDYAAWVEADPRVRQINGFFQELGRLTGISGPQSSASARSSRATRRR